MWLQKRDVIPSVHFQTPLTGDSPYVHSDSSECRSKRASLITLSSLTQETPNTNTTTTEATTEAASPITGVLSFDVAATTTDGNVIPNTTIVFLNQNMNPSFSMGEFGTEVSPDKKRKIEPPLDLRNLLGYSMNIRMVIRLDVNNLTNVDLLVLDWSTLLVTQLSSLKPIQVCV